MVKRHQEKNGAKRLIPRTFLIREDQAKALRLYSNKTRIPINVLVRQAVDLFLATLKEVRHAD